MNLLSLAERLAELESAPIRLSADRCVRARDKTATCDVCQRACPSSALHFDRSITIKADACQVCGGCLHVCPTGAFDGDDGVADLLNCVARLEPARVIELACAQHPSPQQGSPEVEAVVRTTTCLAALGPSAYLALFAVGVQRVSLRLDACAHCPIGQARTTIAQTVAWARQFLAWYGWSDSVVELNTVADRKPRATYTAKNPPLSRRGLFHLLAAEGPRQIARVLGDAAETAKIKSPSLERRRLINVLRRLPAIAASTPLTGLPFARVMVDETCTACGVCARMCPTGALSFNTGEDNAYQLSFISAGCIDCGACAKVCKPGALQRRAATLGEVTDPAPIVLRSGTLRSCTKCGARFAAETGGEICSVCKQRPEKPSSGFRSPGALAPGPGRADTGPNS